MDMPEWMEKPQDITEHNPLLLMPLTLRALNSIADNNRNGDSRPFWRTTKIQKMMVIGRILQSRPDFVLSDNTATLVHPYIRLPPGPQHFYAHQYYRLIFELSPYSSDSLNLLAISPATPIEFSQHLTNAIAFELQSQLHAEMWEKQKEEIESSYNRNEPESHPQEPIQINIRERIMDVIGSKTRFTHQEIEAELKCPREELDILLDELMISGKIGDIGPYFEVISDQHS